MKNRDECLLVGGSIEFVKLLERLNARNLQNLCCAWQRRLLCNSAMLSGFASVIKVVV